MEKIKVQSEEKHFFDYLKKHAPFYGVFGIRDHVINNKFIEGKIRFLVLDENLKVVFDNVPFSKGGDFHPNVKNKIKELEKTYPKLKKDFIKTEDTVEDLIANLQTVASLKYLDVFYKKHSKKEEKNKKLEELIELCFTKLPDEMFEIEKSSEEFVNFKSICNYQDYSLKNHKNDNSEIEYQTYTEKGKKVVDDCVLFFKNNKSKTPVQDAWNKVLEKNNIETHDSFNLGCDNIPTIKKINYSSMKIIEERRKIKHEKFKEKISKSPETVKFLNELRNGKP